MPFEKAKASFPAVPHAWKRSFIVLSVLFSTEFALMLALPWMLPEGISPFLEAAVDSFLLTTVAFPVLWLMMVYPLQQSARQRDLFLANMFTVIEDERRRIAHELHDGVGQTLTMLVSGLRSKNAGGNPADEIQREIRLGELAQRALADTKQIARGLRPSLLDDLGLTAAIERVAQEIKENHHQKLTVEVLSISGERLPEKVETALFRIFQECMANIVTHAGGTEIEIRVEREIDHVTLSITDNGHGFDVAKAAQQAEGGGHLGLIGMKERAALLGGSFEVKSSQGLGTTITVTIPA